VLERNSAPQGPVVRIEWTPAELSREAADTLRQVFRAARARNQKEEAEDRKTGRVPGGVPGCSSPDFRVTFRWGDQTESGVLHLDCGWFGGGSQVGALVFSEREKAKLKTALRSTGS
jgi:hypothetical protein